MKYLKPLFFITLFSGCASQPIDPLDPSTDLNQDRVQQCPIGFRMEQSTSIVIKSDDENKRKGQTETEFKCVPEN